MQLRQTTNGEEFLEYTERQSKTRTGENPRDRRPVARLKQLRGLSKMVKQNYTPPPPPVTPQKPDWLGSLRCNENIKKNRKKNRFSK